MAVLPPLVWDIRNASWPGACWQTPTGAALGKVPSDECDGNAAEAQQTHSGEVSERKAPGFSVSWTQPGHECEAGKVYVFWVCVTEINDVNHVARSGCLWMLGGRCLEKKIWDGKCGPSPGCSGSDACFSWVHAGSRHSTWRVSETTPFWGSHVVPDTWALAGRDCGTWWPQGSFLGSPQQLYHQGRLVPERKMRITNGRGPWDLFQMS